MRDILRNILTVVCGLVVVAGFTILLLLYGKVNFTQEITFTVIGFVKTAGKVLIALILMTSGTFGINRLWRK